MKVVVVAEFYPCLEDPVLGIWAHKQALAARAAGAEVEVVVLYRPIPPATEIKRVGAWWRALRQPRRATIDGIQVHYVRYLSGRRERHYPSWGKRAARPLRRRLLKLHKRFPFELVHAHYAVPAGDAVRLAVPGVPLVISEHGGDVFHTARMPRGEQPVRQAFEAADLVLANSDGIAAAVSALGARKVETLVLGTDPVTGDERRPDRPTLVTVANLIPRKRHADVLRAIWILRDRHPELRYRIVGDGPERGALEELALSLGIAGRVSFAGALDHDAAVAAGRSGSIFVMPSTEEAFGVAYIEAMAAGRPAIGARGEPGPEHLAARTTGMRLVPPGEPEALAREIEHLLDPRWSASISEDAKRVIAEQFSWEACGRATVAAYTEVLAAR